MYWAFLMAKVFTNAWPFLTCILLHLCKRYTHHLSKLEAADTIGVVCAYSSCRIGKTSNSGVKRSYFTEDKLQRAFHHSYYTGKATNIF